MLYLKPNQSGMQINNKVLFVVFSLGTGGTQRMIVNVTNLLAKDNIQVILYLYNSTKDSDLINQLDKNVKVFKCSSRSWYKNILRLWILANILYFEKINHIISFATNGAYLSLIAKFFFPLRKIHIAYRLVSVDSALFYANSDFMLTIKKILFRNLLLKGVDKIICQSSHMRNSLVKGCSKNIIDKTETIRNFVNFNRIDTQIQEENQISGSYICFVGRLSPEKNVKEIIDAFKQIATLTETKLLIIGDGELADYLINYVVIHGIEDKVLFLGFQDNPYKFIVKAKALILFSSYEGMPNVIVEAMYCKTLIIASDFKGIDDLIVHNEHGFIVQRSDVNGLSESIKKAIYGTLEIEAIKGKAFQRIIDLNKQSIIQYKSLIEFNNE